MLKALDSMKAALVNRVQKYFGTQEHMLLQIDITNSCNLRCSHCYHPHHENEGALDFDGWCQVFDQYDDLLTELHLKPSIVICGGEPFVSKNFEPVLNEIKRRWRNCRVTVLTNGTLIRKERLSMFDGLRVDFQVSLDGPDASRHDQKRGSGSFERSKKGIALLKSMGFSVTSLAILSKTTTDWIPEFFSTAKELQLDGMNFTRLISQGTGKDLIDRGEDAPLNSNELKIAFANIAKCAREFDVTTNTAKPLYHLIDQDLGGNGRFGFQGLVVDYKGNLKVSSRVGFVVGHVLRDGLKNLFLKHPIFVALRNGDVEGCGGCKFYQRCGGDRNAAYAEFGSFLARDPGCWFLKENELKEAL